MPLTVNTNISSLIAQRSLAVTIGSQQTSMQKLASGLRINSAADDAAGLAISNRMTAEIRASTVVKRGMSDGISLIQVADAGLANIQSLLQRNRELAVSAANGALSSGDREKLNTEFQQLTAEIERIANTTSIFDKFPLRRQPPPPPPPPSDVPDIRDKFPTSGTSLSGQPSGVIPVAYIPVGAINVRIDIDGYPGAEDDIQIFTRTGKHVLGTPLDDKVWQTNGILNPADISTSVMTEANGFTVGATYDDSDLLPAPPSYAFPVATTGSYNGMTFSYSGDADRFETGGDYNNGSIAVLTKESVTISETKEELNVMVVGAGVFGATVSWDYMPPIGANNAEPEEPSSYRIVLDAHVNEDLHFLDINRTPADTQTLGIEASNIADQADALTAINQIDDAIQIIGHYRADYGAYQSVLDKAISNAYSEIENQSAARSRITDTDYAATTAESIKAGILKNSAQSMLAQANMAPKLVLKLLE